MLDLLRAYLARRGEIIERIQGLLNAQRRPAADLQDSALLSDEFENCFAGPRPPKGGHYGLRELEEAHWNAGFKPREISGLHNGPADPAELMTRAFYLWQQTRWPGRAGRVRYAQTLFNLYIVRCLELLSLRVWDDGLAQIQTTLDALWESSPDDQPVLVRDARWLVQLAQSLATDDLRAYFVLAETIAGSFSAGDRIEIHTAGVRMAAGHLRSQIRYHATKKNASLNEASVVLSTRESNALDFALLIQELVPLFDAYEQAVQSADTKQRLSLADAILQAVSPDPELFLNRVDLLGPYSMLEHIFIAVDGNGQASYTPLGQRHVQFIDEYKARLARIASPLAEDCPRFKPVAGGYSPYGVLYGFSEDLIKHMVLKAVQPDAEHRFSLEDVFSAGDADKLAWINGWRRLPHLPADAAKLFDYPQQFAEDVFDRIEQALRKRVSGVETKTGRLHVRASDVPDLPDQYIRTASDSWEGKNLVSWQTSGGWRAMSKSILTEVLGAGRDVTIAGLPRTAVETLKLMCPGLH